MARDLGRVICKDVAYRARDGIVAVLGGWFGFADRGDVSGASGHMKIEHLPIISHRARKALRWALDALDDPSLTKRWARHQSRNTTQQTDLRSDRPRPSERPRRRLAPPIVQAFADAITGQAKAAALSEGNTSGEAGGRDRSGSERSERERNAVALASALKRAPEFDVPDSFPAARPIADEQRLYLRDAQLACRALADFTSELSAARLFRRLVLNVGAMNGEMIAHVTKRERQRAAGAVFARTGVLDLSDPRWEGLPRRGYKPKRRGPRSEHPLSLGEWRLHE